MNNNNVKQHNNRQKNYRQLLQSLCDLFMLDRVKHQRLMDDLVKNNQENLPKIIPIKFMRERVQRCLVNQRNTRWVIETMKTMIDC